MNSFERLEDEACRDGINVITHEFRNQRISGLYCDGTIGINKSINTSSGKACVLAEELGHHHTSVGNIIDMKDIRNRKQERQARLWGYNKLIGLTGIIKAFQAGCQSRHEMAELLDTKACKCCAYYSTPPCGFKDCGDGIKAWLEQEAAE